MTKAFPFNLYHRKAVICAPVRHMTFSWSLNDSKDMDSIVNGSITILLTTKTVAKLCSRTLARRRRLIKAQTEGRLFDWRGKSLLGWLSWSWLFFGATEYGIISTVLEIIPSTYSREREILDLSSFAGLEIF